MNVDLTVAPEIAQFAQRGPAHRAAVPETLGARADDLLKLAATPQRWWDRVSFDPAATVRIPLGPATWLLVVPPRQAAECDCRLSTLLAGEAYEGGRSLRPGRARVHGARTAHFVRAGESGYAVSLHSYVM